MNSKTKSRVSARQLQEMTAAAGLGEMQEWREMTAGEFNTAFFVRTEKGSYVLKVAPEPGTLVLTYEKGMMAAELAMCERLRDVEGMWVPRVLYAGEEEAGLMFFAMEYIDAQPMNTRRLTRAQRDDVLHALGGALAALHRQRGTGYGYEQMGLAESWYAAYSGMVGAVMADTERLGARVPYKEEILALLQAHRESFDTVQPRLVHFDVWAGNVFLRDKKLAAVIDWERALWGDRQGDFISLDFVHDIDHKRNAAFVRGYNEAADAPLVFDADTLRRRGFMRVYLSLLMFAEVDCRLPRGGVYYHIRRAFGRRVLRWGLRQIHRADAMG